MSEYNVLVNDLCNQIEEDIGRGTLPTYVYSYPSKRAYRDFESPISLREIWANKTGQVNLYIHIPFCEYHCTFCTLFLTTSHNSDMRDAYIASLERQISTYGELVGHLEVTSIYFGGGTPTTLTDGQFERIMSAIHSNFSNVSPHAEVSVEGTPNTMRQDKILALKSLGFNRFSSGIQSWNEEELKRSGRPYPVETAVDAIQELKAADVENFNLDLIYGLEGQTKESWMDSLKRTVAYDPSTITIYPIVARPLTGVKKRKDKIAPNEFLDNLSMYDLYDASVEFLSAAGYDQNTLVRFTKLDHDGYLQEKHDFGGVPLIGLGAGSRSYSASVHYGTDFAVRKQATLRIISDFIEREHSVDDLIELGYILNTDEQKRRYAILNLSLGRIDHGRYRALFHSDITDYFGEILTALKDQKLIYFDGMDVTLTKKGFKYSSSVSRLFYSQTVIEKENAYNPK